MLLAAVELAPCGDFADLVFDTARTNRAKARHVFFVSGVGRTISLFAGFVAARVASYDQAKNRTPQDTRQGGRGVLRFPRRVSPARSLRFLAGSRLLRGPLEDRQEIILQSKTE
jgi:hypothetical protein